MGFGAAGLATLLLIAPAIGASAQTTSETPGGAGALQHAVASAQLATHSTRGVVETVDAARLVIRDPRHTRQTTFVLNAQTERQGRLAAGVNVTVRYRTEKGANVATAVVVEPAKAKPRDSMAPENPAGHMTAAPAGTAICASADRHEAAGLGRGVPPGAGAPRPALRMEWPTRSAAHASST